MFENTPYAQAFLKKAAFVPYTQEAMNPPAAAQPPAAGAGQPMPPEAQAAPPQGTPQMPPIQIVQGPNGEPVDAETGFIVLDEQQGIEQDPLTGILFNKSLNEFATPEGQPLEAQQAIQMIEQARQQAGEAGGDPMPPEAQAAPAAAPAEMPPETASAEAASAPVAPAPTEQPPVPQQGPGQTFDPETGMMIDDATGLPIDPQTGMIVDPATGQQLDPQTGAVAPAAPEGMPFTGDPEVMKTVDEIIKQNEHNAKNISNLTRNVNSIRTDIQGLRREIRDKDDKEEATFERMDNLLNVLETALQGVR